MAVTITHTQVKSVTGAALLQIVDTVTAATNIAQAVFLFETATQTFSHVASPGDMQAFPDTYASAVTNGQGYYRQTSVTFTSVDLTTANNFAILLASRLRALCVDYNLLLAGFAGTTTATVSS